VRRRHLTRSRYRISQLHNPLFCLDNSPMLREHRLALARIDPS
jgi:hypothetical protein